MIFPAISFTPEGGLAVRMINSTGANSVKGMIVKPGSVTRGFVSAAANDDMPTAVVYDDGIATGSPCRVVVSGLAQVLLKNTVGGTIGYVVYVSDTAGRGDTAASIPANTQHWREIGHCVETVTGGTSVLCWTTLHFN